MQSTNLLFAKLRGFRADPDRLREHFLRTVQPIEATQYRDNRVDYVGWAVTSRDGSMVDGVRRISLRQGSGDNKRGTMPTKICSGYLAEVMAELQSLKFQPYRARIMQLESEGEQMPLHTDARNEAWRLHVPIVTNPNCFFEWERADGEIISVHLPADGSAWMVRVDVPHRAVNRSREAAERMHLLMGMGKPPGDHLLDQPWRPLVDDPAGTA